MNTHTTMLRLLSLPSPILFHFVPLLCCVEVLAVLFLFSSQRTLSHSHSETAQVFLVKICVVKRSEEIKGGKMTSCRYQQKNTLTSCEEMRMGSVVCPKPRRLGLFNHSSFNNHIRPLRRPTSYQSEVEDSGVGAELLDIIHPKGGCYPEKSGDLEEVVAASPPFFCGSPPSRASNPVTQDEQFGNGNFSPFTVASSSPSSSSARSCVPMKLGYAPAAVRIEGFDCLSRDRSNCSISAVA